MIPRNCDGPLESAALVHASKGLDGARRQGFEERNVVAELESTRTADLEALFGGRIGHQQRETLPCLRVDRVYTGLHRLTPAVAPIDAAREWRLAKEHDTGCSARERCWRLAGT